MSLESRKYFQALWIVRNSTQALGSDSIALYPLGVPYLSVKAGYSNCLVYRGKKLYYNHILVSQTSSPTYFTFALHSDAIFVKMQPWTLFNLTGKSVKNISEGYWGLEIIDDRLPSRLLEICYSDIDIKEKAETAERVLYSSLTDFSFDVRIARAIDLIKLNFGVLKIEKLSEELNMSQRRLQQLFYEQLGISPKRLSSIYRLHKVIFDLITKNSTSSILYLYYDQPHFIREFKKMTGMTFVHYCDSIITQQQKKAALSVNLYT